MSRRHSRAFVREWSQALNEEGLVRASLDARVLAVRLLVRMLERGLHFDRALEHPKATPLVHELLYGVCRYYFSLTKRVSRRLSSPLRNKDFDLFCLLLIGALQLRHLRIPSHAAIHSSVEASKRLGKPWAARLINGVLRAVERDTSTLPGREAQFDHPDWLIKVLGDQYPEDWQEYLLVNQTRAPLALRVNRTLCTPEECLARLSQDGISATLGSVPGSLRLAHPMSSDQLPVLSSGMATIQDEGAQLAALLLAPKPGMRVLDACAAPGNKSTHLLESAPGIQLTCLDPDAMRLERIALECARLKLTQPKIVHSALEPLDWWDGQPFDAVLLDPPCSGTGTLRRHPDIKLRLEPADMARHQAAQSLLLDAAWRTLVTGGTLLYSTCSMLKQENDDLLEDFLARESAERLPMSLLSACGISNRDHGLGAQLLPSEAGPDAMYYSLVQKVSPDIAPVRFNSHVTC